MSTLHLLEYIDAERGVKLAYASLDLGKARRGLRTLLLAHASLHQLKRNWFDVDAITATQVAVDAETVAFLTGA